MLGVLKPGGLLVLYVPVDDWRLRRQRRVDPDVNHHLYTWTPLLLANLLREAGFADPNCRVEHRGLPGRATIIYTYPPPRVFEQMTTLVAHLLEAGRGNPGHGPAKRLSIWGCENAASAGSTAQRLSSGLGAKGRMLDSAFIGANHA